MRKKMPPQNRDTIKRIGIFSWSIIGFLVIAALFFYVIYLIRIAVVPLLIATAIAYLISPLMNLLKRKMRRGFVVAITYIIFTGVIGLIFFFFIPVVIDQFRVFIGRFPSYIENLNLTISNFVERSIIINSIENLIGQEIVAPDMGAISQYFMGRFDLENMNLVMLKLKELYRSDSTPKARPIIDLDWDYGEHITADAVAVLAPLSPDSKGTTRPRPTTRIQNMIPNGQAIMAIIWDEPSPSRIKRTIAPN